MYTPLFIHSPQLLLRTCYCHDMLLCAGTASINCVLVLLTLGLLSNPQVLVLLLLNGSILITTSSDVDDSACSWTSASFQAATHWLCAGLSLFLQYEPSGLKGLGLAFELFGHAQKLLQTYSPSAQVEKCYRFPAMFVMSCKTKPSASRRGPFKCRIRAREFRNFRSGQVLDFIGLIACDPHPTGRGTMID